MLLLPAPSAPPPASTTSLFAARSRRCSRWRRAQRTRSRLIPWDVPRLLFKCCFTSTETDRKLIRDEEPRTATSTFKQPRAMKAGSSSVLLYVHRNRKLIRDEEPRTATSTFKQPPSYESRFTFSVALHPHAQTILRTVRDGEPRTSTSTFTRLLSSVRPSAEPTS